MKDTHQEEDTKYSFYVGYKELTTTLHEALKEDNGEVKEGMLEGTVSITYRPQANFKVFAVNRFVGFLIFHYYFQKNINIFMKHIIAENKKSCLF